MGHFEDKVAVVTGGASGIGRSICTYLGQRDAQVVVADRNLEGAEETAAAIAAAGGRAEAACLDVTQSGEVAALIGDTAREMGRIDLLFNNAGISINGEFQDVTLAQWRQIVDVNLWGAVYGCHHVYPIMVEQGGGQIVNTASLAGLIPGGLTSPYSASKYAVVGFSLTLRSEARGYGIKVNALCPGYMRTNIQKTTENVTPYMNSEANRQMNASMRFPTPEDCIEQMMRGVRRNRAIIISPWSHKVFWLLHRALPGFNVAMWTMVIKRMRVQAERPET
jgi:NAD(P)-dependent dehydrogenase (short-subunit alcohol dehydrogenase family)